jgi:hypothetical protein
VLVVGLLLWVGLGVLWLLGLGLLGGISVSATGSKGKVINPRVGVGYSTHIGVDVDHLDALIDYDPVYLTLDRTIPSAKLFVAAGNRCIIRDRSVGQVLPAGFVDEFERGVTVTGFAATDGGKTWLYKDSGVGNPASWQINAGGDAKYIGSAPRAAAVVDGVSANGTLRTTIGAMATSNSAGLAARVTDWNNYIGLLFNYSATPDNKLQLVKRVAGTSSQVAFTTAAPLAPDAVVELILNGTSVSVKVNGTEVIAPQSISDFASVTTHGLLGAVSETSLTWKRVEFLPA